MFQGVPWVQADYWVTGRGVDLASRYWWLAHISILLYSPVIWILMRVMKNRPPMKLKREAFIWNISLSLFSLLGAVLIVFEDAKLLTQLFAYEANYGPATRAVVTIFAVTKAVEFGDTIFLVLRKRPVIFLHWYHHVTVALYSWHAVYVTVTFAHHFAFINLCIHAGMYFYYAMAIVIPRHPVLRALRPYITGAQTLQMFVGMFLSWRAICVSDTLSSDHVFNAWCALVMYTSYAYLFAKFYIENYVKGVRVGMTLFIGTVHISAAIGFSLLWRHPMWKRLSLEVLGGYSLTALLLWLTRRSTSTTKSSSMKPGGKLSTATQSAGEAETLVHSLGRVVLMLLNCTVTWARELLLLRKREQRTREFQKDTEIEKEGAANADSAMRALLASVPRGEKLQRAAAESWSSAIAELGWDAHPIEKWLTLMCVSLPAIYGFNVYGDLFLGLAVHGCLRWVLELHTTGILTNMQVAKFEAVKFD